MAKFIEVNESNRQYLNYSYFDTYENVRGILVLDSNEQDFHWVLCADNELYEADEQWIFARWQNYSNQGYIEGGILGWDVIRGKYGGKFKVELEFTLNSDVVEKISDIVPLNHDNVKLEISGVYAYKRTDRGIYMMTNSWCYYFPDTEDVTIYEG